MNAETWTCILEKNPPNNGLFYVYIANCMNDSGDIIKARYRDKKWLIEVDTHTQILA